VPGLVPGHAVVAGSAVRDEGTSFHYLPPSRVAGAGPCGVAALQRTLAGAGVPFVTGRTWTTDGLYRQTRERVRRRVGEGCVTAGMEAAAFMAAARYRGARFRPAALRRGLAGRRPVARAAMDHRPVHPRATVLARGRHLPHPPLK
jgi:uridine phosphorylase